MKRERIVSSGEKRARVDVHKSAGQVRVKGSKGGRGQFADQPDRNVPGKRANNNGDGKRVVRQNNQKGHVNDQADPATKSGRPVAR